MDSFRSQSGNVLFIILIAVALFAALSYAISKSRIGGKTSTDAEKAQLSQGVIDNYEAAVNAAVLRLKFRGCTTIDYKTPTEWGAEDHKCQVFHPQGGGVAWQDIDVGEEDNTTPVPGMTCNLPWGGTIPNGNSVTAWRNVCGSSSTATTNSITRTCSNGVLSGSTSYNEEESDLGCCGGSKSVGSGSTPDAPASTKAKCCSGNTISLGSGPYSYRCN